MSPLPLLLALVPLAYLIGAIPFGLIVGRRRGVDPRLAGSGNIGATNVGRLLGKRFFLLVFVLDMLKGLTAMVAAGVIVHYAPEQQRDQWQTFVLWLLVGFAAIFGHMYSLFIRFHGGKGVATSAGVVLGLFPYYTLPGLAALAVWIVLFKATRYVSVASMGAAASFPILYVLMGLWYGWDVTGEQWPLLGFSLLVAGMILYKHGTNIARLRAGTEPRVPRR